MKIRTAPGELYLGLFDIFSSKKEISGRFLLFDGKIRTYFSATSLRSIAESIDIPCSVNAYGMYRLPPRPSEEAFF